jgi:phosphoketolase
MSEALLAEMSDVSRVLFPADANSATAALEQAYARRGEIWTMVTSKRPAAVVLSGAQARMLVDGGAIRLRGTGKQDERLLLAATGSYQLAEVLRASDRLEARGIRHGVVYIIDPGRFREARDHRELAHMATPRLKDDLFPAAATLRVFVSHTRPEAMAGALRPLDTGRGRSRFLGYRNRGGTLDTFGMLFANGCTWAHVLEAAGQLLERPVEDLLAPDELAAVRGEIDPRVLDGAASPRRPATTPEPRPPTPALRP